MDFLNGFEVSGPVTSADFRRYYEVVYSNQTDDKDFEDVVRSVWRVPDLKMNNRTLAPPHPPTNEWPTNNYGRRQFVQSPKSSGIKDVIFTSRHGDDRLDKDIGRAMPLPTAARKRGSMTYRSNFVFG